MRISTDKNDPGYNWVASRCHVRFNGQLLRSVVTADEEAGMVQVYRKKDGATEIRDGKAMTKVMHGEVVIEYSDDVRDVLFGEG